MECMYCTGLAINAEMFVVRQAVKANGAPKPPPRALRPVLRRIIEKLTPEELK